MNEGIHTDYLTSPWKRMGVGTSGTSLASVTLSKVAREGMSVMSIGIAELVVIAMIGLVFITLLVGVLAVIVYFSKRSK